MTGHSHTLTRDANRAFTKELVRRFESCALPPSEFSHRAHLTVALVYLVHLPPDEARERMCTNIRNFLHHHQLDLQKYNKTITLFWLKVTEHYLKNRGVDCPIEDLARELLERYGDSRLIFSYYSESLILSLAARAAWVEPDLRPIDF